MREVNRLNANTVKDFLAANDPNRPGKIADGMNLYLQDTGSWIFRYRQRGTGRVREIGLGSASVIPLASARAKARALNEGLARGEDPKAKRVERRTTELKQMTFGDFIPTAMVEMTSHLKNKKSATDLRRLLENHAKPLWTDLLTAIDRDRVKAVVRGVAATISRTTANNVRRAIRGVFDEAIDLKLCAENPASGRLLPKQSRAAQKAQKEKHHEAIPLAGLQSFIAKLRGIDAVKARLVEFQALTATRPSEARLAQWSEIDLIDGLWIIPDERMKMGEEHRIPLCPRAVAILRELQNGSQSEFVFVNPTTCEPFSNKTAIRLIQGHYPTATAHGFRSCFPIGLQTKRTLRKRFAKPRLPMAPKSRTRRTPLTAGAMVWKPAAKPWPFGANGLPENKCSLSEHFEAAPRLAGFPILGSQGSPARRQSCQLLAASNRQLLPISNPQ
jgi:integrase